MVITCKVVRYLDLKVSHKKDNKKIYRATYLIRDGKSTSVVHVLGKELIMRLGLSEGCAYVLEGFAASLKHKHVKHKYVTNIYITDIIRKFDIWTNT